jgi:hypothetical protein
MSTDDEMPNSETSSMDSVSDSPDHVLNKFGKFRNFEISNNFPLSAPTNPYILGVFICSSTVWLFSGLTMMFSAFSVSDVCPKGQNCTLDPNTINADVSDFQLFTIEIDVLNFTPSLQAFHNNDSKLSFKLKPKI